MNPQELKDEERGKLFLFASFSFIALTVGFLYIEVYALYDVPNFIRVVLAFYWLYSLVAMFVSRFAADRWVGKMCCNIFRQ